MRECGENKLTEITFLVLLAFFKPCHGYGVMQFLDKNTEGRIRPGAGTLYGVINTLIKKKWIELYEQDERKKVYLITDKGKEIVEEETERIKQNYLLAKDIIGGGIKNGEI